MVSVSDPSTNLNERNKKRAPAQFFVEVKARDEQGGYSGVMCTTDISDSGIGLITYHPFQVGTIIEISKDGEVVAIGEVVNLNDEWDAWDWAGIDRMGVRIIEKKSSWPLQ